MSIKKAVIPAAGMGTRFLPATKAMPKEMLPIVDKPTLQYIVEEAVASGIEEILIITGRGKNAIENHFDRSIELENLLKQHNKTALYDDVRAIPDMARIYYTRQKEPLGLGHAVSIARNFCGGEPFAVLLGDDIVHADKPCLSQLIAAYEQCGHTVLGVQPVPEQDISKYGVIATRANRDTEATLLPVQALVEKPKIEDAPSQFAVMGRYIITPAIFNLLDQIEPGKGNEIQLTDALNLLASTEAVSACVFKGTRYDAGDKIGYLKANIEFALERPALAAELRKYLKQLAATL